MTSFKKRRYGSLIPGIAAILLGLVVTFSPWIIGIFVGSLLIFAGFLAIIAATRYGLLITGVLALLLGLVVTFSPMYGGIVVGPPFIFAGIVAMVVAMRGRKQKEKS